MGESSCKSNVKLSLLVFNEMGGGMYSTSTTNERRMFSMRLRNGSTCDEAKTTKFKLTLLKAFAVFEQTVPNHRFEYPFLPSMVIVLQTFGPNLLDNQTSILDSDTGYVCGGKYCIKKEVRVSVFVYNVIN